MFVMMWRCSEVFSDCTKAHNLQFTSIDETFLLRNLAYYVVVSRQDERVTDKPLIFDLASAGRLTSVTHHVTSQRLSCCRVA